MKYAIALFAAIGCTVIGWAVGLGVFAVAFEFLRARDLDAALNSRSMLELFRYGFALIGFGTGLWIFLGRCIWSEMAPEQVSTARPFIVAGLAGLGGAALGQFLDPGGWAIRLFEVSKDTYIFIMLAASGFLLSFAAILAMFSSGPPRKPAIQIMRGALAVVAAGALVFVCLAFDKAISQPYDRLGDTKSYAWFMVRFPVDASATPDKSTIRVEMRTDKGKTRGFASEWLREGERHVLRASVDINDRSRDRTIVVTLPGQPELAFKMPFSANPKRMHDYGTWHRIDRIGANGHARAPHAADDFTIKYMIH